MKSNSDMIRVGSARRGYVRAWLVGVILGVALAEIVMIVGAAT